MKLYPLSFLILIFLACQSNPIADSPAPKSPEETQLKAIQMILAADDSLGGIRNIETETKPLRAVIESYTTALKALDFSKCPKSFSEAFQVHINAWENMLPLTDSFPDVRGEMHDLFEQIESTHLADPFKVRLNEIWNTWYPVEALHKDAEMFHAVGGKDRWAALKTLYIKAIHEEPQMDSPYVSEIWRAVDHFKIRIEQQNDVFHNLGVFSEKGGWVNYKHRDTTRKLSDEQLEDWKRGHEQNIYVLLHRLASADYKVAQDSQGRLAYRIDAEPLCSFKLDSLFRPFEFYTPNPDGTENSSTFAIWRNTAGYVHTAGGGPKDGSFSYETEIWMPSDSSFDALYDFEFDWDHRTKTEQ